MHTLQQPSQKSKTNIWLRFAAVVLFLFILQPLVAQTSWKGTVSTAWTNAANWTNGVPSVTVDAIIGDANFTGDYHPEISSPVNLKSLTIGTGTKMSTITISKPVTVNGNVVIGANGALEHTSNNSISVQGNWSNSGTYNATHVNASVTFSGSVQGIAGATNFRKLTINQGSLTTLTGSMTIVKSLVVAGTLNPNNASNLVSFSGGSSFVVEARGVLQVKASTFSGNYSATPTLMAGSIVEYASTVNNQTVAAFSYSTLRISGATIKTLASSITLQSSAAAVGNLEVISGTLDLTTRTLNRGTSVAGGSVTVSAEGTLKIGGTNSFPANYSVSNLATTSTIEYNGANQTVSNQPYGNLVLSSSSGAVVKTMPTASMIVANDLTSTIGAGSSVSFTAGASISVGRNLTIGSATTFSGGSYNHTISGNWVNNGTFNGSTGTITINGTGKVIDGTSTTTFNNLAISGYGTVAVAASVIVNGNFTTTGAGSFTHNGTLTMTGSSKIISGSGITYNNLTISGNISTASSLLLTGNLAVSGTFNATGGTLEMSGSSKTISGAGAISLHGFRATGTVSTAISFSLKAELMGVGKLTATAGTINFIGATTYAGAHDLFNATLNGTTLQLGANSVLGIGGAFAITSGSFDVATTAPNTVNYNGAGAQTITATVYSNLTLSGGGTKSAAGNIAARNLTISGVTFSAGTYTHTVSGNWINNGSFNAASSTIQLSGDMDASISGTSVFNVLSIAKGASAIVRLVNAMQTATLNMVSGELHTGSTSITITTTRTGNGIIYGTITRTHTFTIGVAYAFESPFNTVTFTSIIGSVSSITVKVSSSSQETSPLDGAINRNYTVSMTNSGTYVASMRLHYLDSELSGNTESLLELWRYTSSWAKSGKWANDTSNNWVENILLLDITGRWTLSNDNAIAVWKGTTSSAWETAANWKSGSVPDASHLVYIGTEAFTHQPVISSGAAVKAITFGSTGNVTLTLNSTGALTVSGNLRGEWTGNAAHTLNINSGQVTINGELILGYGNASKSIDVNLGTGALTVMGSLHQTAGADMIFSAPGTLGIGQHFYKSGGNFTANTGTVNYSGNASQTVASLTYHNLTFNKPSGSATINTALVINGNLSIINGGVIDINANLTIGGDVSIGNGTTVNEAGATLTLGGNWSRTGVFNPTTGTIIFNGAADQLISASTFNRITISKPISKALLTGNIVINGNLTVTEGTLELGTYSANRSILGGSLTLGSNTLLKIGGASNFPANFNVRDLASTSTVEYNGTVAQTIMPLVYGNVTLTNGSAAKSLTNPVTITGSLLINTGATLQTNANTLTLNGDFLNYGDFIPSTGTVVLTGSGKQLSGSTTFNNLIITGSYSGQSGANLVINGNVDLSGYYAAGSNAITLHGNLVLSGTYASDGVTTYTGTRVQTLSLRGNIISPNAQGLIVFDGTVPPVLNSMASPVFLNVDIKNTSTIRPSMNWTVAGTFTVAPGSTFDGGALSHTFFGTVLNNGSMLSNGVLSFLPQLPYATAMVDIMLGDGASFESLGKVVFGGSQQINLLESDNTFNNVVISNTHSGGITPKGDWTLLGDFVVNNGALFNGGDSLTHTFEQDLTIEGTLTGGTSNFIITPSDSVSQIAGGGTISFHTLVMEGNVSSVADFEVSGDFVNNEIFDPGSSVVTFVGEHNATIGGSTSPANFDVLVINKTNASVSLEVPLSNLSLLHLAGGTLADEGLSIIQSLTGGSLLVDDNATFLIDSLNTLPEFDNYAFEQNSTTAYIGLEQTIAQVQYGNLNLQGGLKTVESGTTGMNNFSNEAAVSMPAEAVIQLEGDWNNNGSFSSIGDVEFVGVSTQQISGATVTDFKNMLVTNVASPGVQVQTNQNLTGILTLTNNVVFDADGSNNTSIFTVKSTSDGPSGDAAIAPLLNGAQVIGNVTVERYMSIEGRNKTRIYRYISSPVENGTIADIQNEIPVTGNFTGRTLCSTCGKKASLFYYDETVITDLNKDKVINSNDGYRNFPNGSNTEKFAPGRGYSMFVRGDLITSAKWDVRSTINKGNITLPVSYTSSGDLFNDGWNLVGNPYPSAIDWNAAGWIKQHVDAVIYITDNGGTTSKFATWNGVVGTNGGSRYIATGQGFWVKANGAGTPTLTATETVKASGQQPTFFRISEIENLLRITLVKGAVKDETIVHFRDDATEGFDSNADAWKLPNSSFNLSTLLPDGKKLAINSLPALTCSAAVKLSVDNAANGSYRFDFTELETFSIGITIQLVDKFLNKTVDIRNGSYSFSVTSDAASKGGNRFELKFATASVADFSVATTMVCEGKDGVVEVINSQKGILYSLTVNGTAGNFKEGNGGMLLLPVSKSLLKAGSNVVIIQASAPGCAANSMDKSVILEVDPTTITAVESKTICGEGSVVLKAVGAAVGGSYRWYESSTETQPLAGQQSPEFITPHLTVSRTYYVSIVNSLGCEGARVAVLATVIPFVEAIITQENNVLKSNYTHGNQWFFNGNAIDGATNQTWEAESTGIYKVEVSNGTCQTSAEASVVITSAELPSDEITIRIYPNPVRDRVMIEAAESDQDWQRVQVLTSGGIPLINTMLESRQGLKQLEIDMQPYQTGVYIIVLTGRTKSVSYKILKK